MPTFVIHTIGQPSKQITLDKPSIRVGRDPKNHLVLGDKTVSREHAIFETDLVHRWYVACVSETNPVVVDGKMVTKRKYVQEGAEILVGKEHLLVFCTSAESAARRLGDSFAKSTCKKCGWSGVLSAATKPPCPECGAGDLLIDTSYTKEQAVEGSTSLMSPAQLGVILGRLKAAKGSRIERVDGRDPPRRDLSEAEATVLARGEGAGLRLFGFFVFGQGVTVAWNGTQFVARSAMLYPPMKINGARVKEAALSHGDLIEVGSNHFRFVTG
jgi:pSer/pThr/pTyr-binding forkhead associated (FHA) protein